MLDDGTYSVPTNPENPTERSVLNRKVYWIEGENFRALRLDVDRLSEPFEYEGPPLLHFYQSPVDEGASPRRIGRIRLDPEGSTEGLLFFNPTESVAHPDFSVGFLPFRPESLERNSLKIFNYFGRQIAIDFLDQRELIEANASVTLDLNHEDARTFQPMRLAAYHEDGDEWKLVANRFFRPHRNAAQFLLILPVANRDDQAQFQIVRIPTTPPQSAAEGGSDE